VSSLISGRRRKNSVSRNCGEAAADRAADFQIRSERVRSAGFRSSIRARSIRVAQTAAGLAGICKNLIDIELESVTLSEHSRISRFPYSLCRRQGIPSCSIDSFLRPRLLRGSRQTSRIELIKSNRNERLRKARMCTLEPRTRASSRIACVERRMKERKNKNGAGFRKDRGSG